MIITYPLNGIEYSAEDAETYLCSRTSGVFSSDISITPGEMSITIGPFLAWIKNDNFKGKSVVVTEPVTLNIEAADAVLNRIDRIVLRFDSSQNSSNLVVLSGTASGNPVAPSISRTVNLYDLCIADVAVNAGATSISVSDITSQLLNEDLCGIMRDSVTGIPTAQLQEQVDELIERLHAAISGVESGSAFMIGEIYDPNGKAKEVAFADEVLGIFDGVANQNEIWFPDSVVKMGHANADISSYFIIYGGKDVFDGAALSLITKSYTDSTLAGAFRLSSSDGTNTKILVGKPDGTLTWAGARLFGTHNKPYGTYTGNGSISDREITVGDDNTFGTTLVITSSKVSALITKNGGIFVGYDPSGENLLSGDRDTTFDGKKLIASSAMMLNEPGIKYTYYVL